MLNIPYITKVVFVGLFIYQFLGWLILTHSHNECISRMMYQRSENMTYRSNTDERIHVKHIRLQSCQNENISGYLIEHRCAHQYPRHASNDMRTHLISNARTCTVYVSETARTHAGVSARTSISTYVTGVKPCEFWCISPATAAGNE